MSLLIVKMVVSSAKSMLELGGRKVGSYMKAERGIGPRKEPCGTPEDRKPEGE